MCFSPLQELRALRRRRQYLTLVVGMCALSGLPGSLDKSIHTATAPSDTAQSDSSCREPLVLMGSRQMTAERKAWSCFRQAVTNERIAQNSPQALHAPPAPKATSH